MWKARCDGTYEPYEIFRHGVLLSRRELCRESNYFGRRPRDNQCLEHSPVYEHIDKLGNMARQDMNRIFEEADFPAQAVGVGSFFAIHLTNKKPLKDISDFTHYGLAQSKRRFNYLLENGIVILISEMMHGAASYAHKEKDINYLTTCAENVKSRS